MNFLLQNRSHNKNEQVQLVHRKNMTSKFVIQKIMTYGQSQHQ